MHPEFFSELSKIILLRAHCFGGINMIFFFLIWALRPVKIISLILSRVNRKVGRKREIPEKKHLTTRTQNLACLTWPEQSSNPQRWDDERFRVLKISGLNHLATGAANIWFGISYSITAIFQSKLSFRVINFSLWFIMNFYFFWLTTCVYSLLQFNMF